MTAPLLVLTLALLFSSFEAGARTTVTLTPEQLFEFDQTGWVTLNSHQKKVIGRKTGIAPSRVYPVYQEPDGERAELGYNLALRLEDRTLIILHDYLLSDEQVKARIRKDRKQARPGTSTGGGYPSFLIDAEGRYWKHLSQKALEQDLREARPARVYLHLPQSLPDRETVATRDTLRRTRALLERHRLPTTEITRPTQER